MWNDVQTDTQLEIASTVFTVQNSLHKQGADSPTHLIVSENCNCESYSVPYLIRPWQFKKIQYALVRMRHKSRIIASYTLLVYDAYPVVLVMYSPSGVMIVRGVCFSSRVLQSFRFRRSAVNIGAPSE